MSLSRTQRKLLLGLAVVVSVLSVGVIIFEIMDKAFVDEYRRLEVIKVGMTEKEVIQRLGSPHKVYHRGTAPENYYVSGYAHKERAISNKVFIYSFNEPIAYYYFDKDNKVEDIFIGGS